jgi:hypothetical protein
MSVNACSILNWFPELRLGFCDVSCSLCLLILLAVFKVSNECVPLTSLTGSELKLLRHLDKNADSQRKKSFLLHPPTLFAKVGSHV